MNKAFLYLDTHIYVHVCTNLIRIGPFISLSVNMYGYRSGKERQPYITESEKKGLILIRLRMYKIKVYVQNEIFLLIPKF